MLKIFDISHRRRCCCRLKSAYIESGRECADHEKIMHELKKKFMSRKLE